MTAAGVLLSFDSRSMSDARAARLSAARTGDVRALEAILAELQPSVRRWTAHALGRGADAEDAAQDALIAIAAALPGFEGRAKLTTWAHRITLRTAFKSRRRKRPLPTEHADRYPGGIDPEATVAGRETLARLYRVLERLPAKRRAAFVLCVIEGHPPSRAAEIEGCSALAMRGRVHHARKEVARMMQGDPWVDAQRNAEGRR